MKSSFIFHEDVRKYLFKLLNKKGILNIGGKTQSIYNFAKKSNKRVKKDYLKKNSNHNIPFNSSLNILNLNKFLKKKKIID